MPTDKEIDLKYKSGVGPIAGILSRTISPESKMAKQHKKYGGKTQAEASKENYAKPAKASGGFDPKPIDPALFDSNNFAKQKDKSRPRTSSEMAVGIKNTPSKMTKAGLTKPGNTMLMGSKEVETPSTFNASAANNMAKAPNFAKMAESGATAKEIKSSFKDYKKVVKGQIKDYKTGIKVQNKAARAENKATRAEKQTSKKEDRLTKKYNKAMR